jgi:hypothetical protein
MLINFCPKTFWKPSGCSLIVIKLNLKDKKDLAKGTYNLIEFFADQIFYLT